MKNVEEERHERKRGLITEYNRVIQRIENTIGQEERRKQNRLEYKRTDKTRPKQDRNEG
jgi:hypothetical protein